MTLNKILVAVWRNGYYEPVGFIYFNKQNGLGGFQYLQNYNGAPLDPIHLNYNVHPKNPNGNRNFIVKIESNPSLLHRVFQNFLPAKWGGSVMAADYPEMTVMCGAEKLYFIGSRTVGGLSTKVVDGSERPKANEKPYLFEGGDNSLKNLSKLMQTSIDFFKKEIPLIDIPNARWGLTSHGGARPKVSMIDGAGRNWIVKFDMPFDDVEGSTVEHALTVLARSAGINAPETKVIVGSEGKKMFAIERYDIDGNGRYFQTSMFSLMSQNISSIIDGDYKNMFDVLDAASSDPSSDKKELFRRMLFNVAVNNIDDHLENFSMILKDDKWQLSPCYDITLDPQGRNHLTSIFGMHEIDLNNKSLISNIASKVGISAADALNILGDVVDAVADWQTVFERCGVCEADIAKVSDAFSAVEAKKREASASFGFDNY